MTHSDLLRTDAHIAQLLGRVDRCDGYCVVRTPDNPGFYFGNFLILDQPPTSLGKWLCAFEEAFGPEIEHRCISWAGTELDEALEGEAKSLGLESDSTLELRLEPSFLKGADGDCEKWTVRPLDPAGDWDASVALSLASESTTADASQGYRLFTERQRGARREWLKRGLATWWGVFAEEQLVGQCGLVPCGEIGRYQVVETHPGWRRRGICTALISTVARDAFDRLHLKKLILAAEIDGPAIALYTRIGFKETGRENSLVRHAEPMRVRDEGLGDQAGVRSLVNAAFQTPQEAPLIEKLRLSPGAISLVAEQSNSLLGHILFSKLTRKDTSAGPSAVALAPLAVRPTAQGKGVGSALIQAGLGRCKLEGHHLCVVIGSSDYYGRFGFEPASPHGLRNPFGVEDEHFMVKELVPGALQDYSGDLVYDPAFEALT